MIALGTHLALVARVLDEARWYGAILSARVELAAWHLRRGAVSLQGARTYLRARGVPVLPGASREALSSLLALDTLTPAERADLRALSRAVGSQYALSRALGVSLRTVERLLRGQRVQARCHHAAHAAPLRALRRLLGRQP